MSRWEYWVSRAALLVAALGLGRVGILYVVAPTGPAEQAGMLLTGAAAVSNARVAIGGFHLGLALIAAFGLVSRRGRRSCLSFVAALLSTVLAVRLASLVVDGTDPRLLFVLGAESVTWLLLGLGLLAERRLARRERHGGA